MTANRVWICFLSGMLGLASIQAQDSEPLKNEALINVTPAEQSIRGIESQATGSAALSAKSEEEKKLIRELVEEALREREEKKKKEAAASKTPTLTAVWKNGLYLETPNKDFSLHLGGTIQYDGIFYTADRSVSFGRGGVGPLNDAVTPRRMRLRSEGIYNEVFDFKLEFEFVNGGTLVANSPATEIFSPSITEAYVTFLKLPVLGNIRIGNQKEPFSLEHLQSDRFINFMERSYMFDAFNPTPFNNGFNPGILAFNTALDERIQWAIGGFKNDRNVFGSHVGDGQYAVTGRVTGLPAYEDEGSFLVHLGFAGSHRDLVRDLVALPPNDFSGPATRQFRVRPTLRNGPPNLVPILANTGILNGESESLLGGELAAVFGPLTLKGEYQADMISSASTPNGRSLGTYFGQGFYVESLLFLTGENSRYNKAQGVFDRDIPLRNFRPFATSGDPGFGAVQLVSRFNYIDLSNKGVLGGTLQDVTLGVNWILNPNTRLVLNYDTVYRSNTGTPSDGWIQGLGMRLQMDF